MHYAGLTTNGNICRRHIFLHLQTPFFISQQSEAHSSQSLSSHTHLLLIQLHLLHFAHICPEKQPCGALLLVPSHFTLHSQGPLPILGKPQQSLGHGCKQPIRLQNAMLLSLQPHLLHLLQPVSPATQGEGIGLASSHRFPPHKHLRLSADRCQQSPLQEGQPIKVHAHLPLEQKQRLHLLHFTAPFLHS